MFRVGDNELIDGELVVIMEATEVDDGELLRVEDQFGNEKFYKYSDGEDEFIEIDEEEFYQLELFDEEVFDEEIKKNYEEIAKNTILELDEDE